MTTLAALAAPGMGTRIFGGALALIGLLAVGVALYLRLRPGRMSAKPYRPPAPPYGPPPGGGEPPPDR